MKILIINGGMPEGGRTELLTRYIANKYSFQFIDINAVNLPILTGESDQWQLPSVLAFKEKVRLADGIILISPEYHGGMTGALKNTLDFLTKDQLSHKPVALVATAGGGKGGINCLNNMRTVMRGFYANVIPKQIVLDPDGFNYDSRSLWEDSANMVDEMVQQLTMYCKMTKHLELEIESM